MPFRAVLDSDGLIKLAKAGILETVLNVWDCLIPEAVYAETVERGTRAAYPDAQVIRELLHPSTVRPWIRHPRATALLERKRNLGRGEQETLHLYFTARADAIISDDAAFLTVLRQAGLHYLPPPLVLVLLAHQQRLRPKTAHEALERMRPFIRPEVYQAARKDLKALLPRRPERAKEGKSP